MERAWQTMRMKPLRRFNGAMTLRSWRAHPPTAVSLSCTLLQWGHDLAVMERPAPMPRPTSSPPLQWGHDLAVMERGEELVGDITATVLQWGHDLAVMESRFRACNPMPLTTRFNGAMTLRSWRGPWRPVLPVGARRFNGAMTLRSWRAVQILLNVLSWVTLQWGHDLAVMESRMCGPSTSASTGFNGAMTLRSWRGHRND